MKMRLKPCVRAASLWRMTTHEIVFGRQPVLEMLKAGRRPVKRLFMADNVRRSAAMIVRLEKMAEKRSVKIEPMYLRDMDCLCHNGNHQGVAAEVGEYPYADWKHMREEARARTSPSLFLLADHVQDPQNLGSMLRSADVAGVDGVVIPQHRAAAVTPAVVRASAGAAEYMQVALVSNLGNVVRDLKEDGVRVAGLEGLSEAKLYYTADLSGSLALVVGGEDEGLSHMIRGLCDVLIRIPQFGRVGSLNAAVAAAIALFEARRQQRP